MFKTGRVLRCQPLEGRMMLSLSVIVENSTIVVESDDGADNDVAIRQTWSNYLIVKEHDELVAKIDLDQFDHGWNLYVDLNRGNDELKINHVGYGLKQLDIHTGGELGFTNVSDNDMVRLRKVKAHGIQIHTGATIGRNGLFTGEGTTFIEGVPYYDNDEVKLYETAVYGGGATIRTGTDVNIAVMPRSTYVDTLTTNGNAIYQLQDNDRVHVVYSHFAGGNLDVETGTDVHATVWHDHDCLVPCVPHVETVDYDAAALLVSVYDNDHVSVREVKVVNGSIEISTGVDMHMMPAGDDLVDFAFAEFNGNNTELRVHVEDRDMVDLSWVSVRKHDYSSYFNYLGGKDSDWTNNEDAGNVRIDTGADIVNNDPYVYLAVELNDDDRASLYGVVIGHSLSIWTGVGANGMIGDCPEGNGTSDQDLVELKYVKQVSRKGSTYVSMGDDNDQLRIYGSYFRGYATFDGGDGINTKKVVHTFFAHPPEFLNFMHEYYISG